MPKAIADRVDPAKHLLIVWRAFWALTNDRQFGALGGCGYIPFMAIDRYAERYGISGVDEFERFQTLLRQMDDAYLAWIGEHKDD